MSLHTFSIKIIQQFVLDVVSFARLGIKKYILLY